MSGRFEEIEHTADVAVHVWGCDLAELFVQAALGMAYLLADPTTVQPTTERLVNLNAGDVETLLVSWLSELLYLGEQEGALELVFDDFDVHAIGERHIRATARGRPPAGLRRYIKAVTFSDLSVERTPQGYETEVVFDV